MSTRRIVLSALALHSLGACAPLNPGVPGSPAVTYPAIDGTVFTIVFENQNADDVLVPALPTFYELAGSYGRADAYVSHHHPSLANYIVMTSGTTHGIASSQGPESNPVQITDTEHLVTQFEEAGIPWRAYMEGMGEPCGLRSDGRYAANHDPFVYYRSFTDDTERCREHVVDFDAHFADDLAANRYRYMWITPDHCNDMHDCPTSVGDAWLGRLLPTILSSEGYLAGGVVFILFDEGYLRLGGAGANLATLVLSPRLVARPYATNTRFDHRSYLATIEDIFGLPRLPTTVDAVPMSEFFVRRSIDGAGE